MYAASIQSTTGTLAGYARKMTQNGRPDMEIILEDHNEGKTYTTFDPLSGRVEITAPHEARFDEIRITLEGTVKTFVENLSPHSTKARTTATHNFLRLSMPIRESDYPQPRIAEAGRTYTFPFNFVVPDQLLPRSCSHACVSDHVRDAHLRLPPSMGGRSFSGQDDLTPEMAKVNYAIKVKIVRTRERDGQEVVLVEGSKKIHIIPAIAEEPPMSVTHLDKDYVLSKTKSLKKGMFSGKLGKITVTAAQPNALVLPAPSASSTMVPGTTMTTVNLRFDPHDSSSQPPRLGGLTTKIKASTFYAARPAMEVPSHFGMVHQFESTRGVYDTSVPLSSRCVEAVTWTRHTPSPAYVRRNSASSTSSDDCSDEIHASPPKENKPYYTAEILLPITLPTSKAWIPTFHTCILSRSYTIDLSLTIHTPGTGVPASTVALHLPVQIAANGNNARRATLTAEEAAAELADADEFLRPRVLEMPSPELVGNSVINAGAELPPSYEDFAVPRRSVVSRG
ncbi:uncharacterized protein LY89DRAFT_679552 [Mollisia scopiformis]|uniref:Arrestin-like N-terminal domain-containing protein n=1 Tax=Mollisia scopiformis TaxID=149040 RepID=A0A194XVN5_MOLSC|nr:uncharacterized protein LY89DRAFT_679552 [Mollisia scopiformis]KUJ24395.1 hypothetical protein LY89DRAFT_679552 [Mollisia scopiformis]